ncbi:MAG: AbrB/MazE/SpoVT family DNA-binding domain-containing protein [Pseudomonadota bacterium]
MSKVTTKYQITIPPEIRKELGIIPGTDVQIKKQGDHFVLIVNPIDEIKKRWQGKFRNGSKTDEYLNEIRGKVS